MNILSPSILSADFAMLGEQVRIIDEAGTQYIHIDVMDGTFVPEITFGAPIVRAARSVTQKMLDVHLMIVKPEKHIEVFAKAGADLITFHLEATECAEQIIEDIHARGLRAGISIKPKTPVEELVPYLDKVDMILIMTVEPGYGGQAYIEDCTEKIRQTRRMVEASGRDIDIEVDGGIKADNVHVVLEAGANVVVAGSAVFKNDIAGNVREFLRRMA
ncbi:MAG: ribulose-phosphate 3-epimerase [Lachnospiraceae bacterium]|nr:ribulose-phosphate 3-epimerase [Lachnospiraceae bacterium]